MLGFCASSFSPLTQNIKGSNLAFSVPSLLQVHLGPTQWLHLWDHDLKLFLQILAPHWPYMSFFITTPILPFSVPGFADFSQSGFLLHSVNQWPGRVWSRSPVTELGFFSPFHSAFPELSHFSQFLDMKFKKKNTQIALWLTWGILWPFISLFSLFFPFSWKSSLHFKTKPIAPC